VPTGFVATPTRWVIGIRVQNALLAGVLVHFIGFHNRVGQGLPRAGLGGEILKFMATFEQVFAVETKLLR
jgi:hypothetical protein